MRVALLSLLFFFLSPITISAASWYYPVANFPSRTSDKAFGQYFDLAWYTGKTDRFPAKFTGFHAAIDLEVTPAESSSAIPVYAVSDGKITFAGPVSGYGGLILLQLAGTQDTALYGHLRQSSFTVRVGQSVSAGTHLADLGTAFSQETGGERQHLHFAIYRGTDLYFKGYESSQSALSSRWYNPTDYLNQHSPLDPSAPTPTLTPSPLPSPFPTPMPTSTPSAPRASSPSIFQWIANLFTRLWSLLTTSML